MESVCSMPCTQLSLGEHLFCIPSAKMPCTGSKEENCLCLAREESFLFSWKQLSSLWWRNPSLSSKGEAVSRRDRGRDGKTPRQSRETAQVQVLGVGGKVCPHDPEQELCGLCSI